MYSRTIVLPPEQSVATTVQIHDQGFQRHRLIAPAIAMRGKQTRLLVIVVARIGDTLLATPAIKALKDSFPDCELTVVAHPKRVELLRFLPFLDRLRGMTKRSAPWRGRLPGHSFDMALVYGADHALIAYASRVAHSVYIYTQAKLPNTPRVIAVERPEKALHAVRERLLIAEATGAKASDLRLQYAVSRPEADAAQAWRSRHIPLDAHPVIGLQTLSFPTKPHRNWPLDSFAGLIACVLEQYPNAHFVVLGDDAARQQATALSARFPRALTIAAGTTSLRQSAALIAGLDLYVGVDTGPTHLAGALDVPMVALYHCAFPGRYLMPLDRPSCVMIEHPLTAHTNAATPSMADISVEQVWNAVRSLLVPTEKNGSV